MVLGAVGSFVSESGGAALSATTSVVKAVASVVESYPLLTAVVALGAYEWLGGSNNPDHLGNNVDTKA
jgi:hypothetical protein